MSRQSEYIEFSLSSLIPPVHDPAAHRLTVQFLVTSQSVYSPTTVHCADYVVQQHPVSEGVSSRSFSEDKSPLPIGTAREAERPRSNDEDRYVLEIGLGRSVSRELPPGTERVTRWTSV